MINEVNRFTFVVRAGSGPWLLVAALFCGAWWPAESRLLAQSVGLPAPRLLTTMPMGGKVGTRSRSPSPARTSTRPSELIFSDRRITAKRKAERGGAAGTE